jgi:hypothetical protein
VGDEHQETTEPERGTERWDTARPYLKVSGPLQTPLWRGTDQRHPLLFVLSGLKYHPLVKLRRMQLVWNSTLHPMTCMTKVCESRVQALLEEGSVVRKLQQHLFYGVLLWALENESNLGSFILTFIHILQSISCRSHVVDLRHVKEPYTAWVRCFVGQISRTRFLTRDILLLRYQMALLVESGWLEWVCCGSRLATCSS